MSDDKTILVSSGAPWEAIHGYSRAVRKGNMIWVSGTTAIKDGIVIGIGDPYLQAVTCLQTIKAAIEAAGGQIGDVVKTRIFVTQMDDWEKIAQAHLEFFEKIRPASTMVQIVKLIHPDILVEIEAEAMVL